MQAKRAHKIAVKGPAPSATLVKQLVRMQERLGKPPRKDGHLIGGKRPVNQRSTSR